MSYFGIFNERFTLVDVDGVELASPGDELDILEPVNFKNVKIKNQRSRKWRAFNAEFVNSEELDITFDDNILEGETQSAFGLISSILSTGGFDSDVRLRAYRTPTGGSEEYKEYGLVLSGYDEEDYKVKVRAKRIDFKDKLRTRFQESIDIESSENLDGVSDTPITLQEIMLHGRRQKLEDIINMGPGSDLLGNGGYTFPMVEFATGQSLFWNWMDFPVTEKSDNEAWQNVQGYSDIEPYTDTEFTSYHLKETKFSYEIDIKFAFILDVFFNGFEEDFDWKLKYSINKGTPVTIASGNAFTDEGYTTLIDDEGYTNAYRIRVDIDASAPAPRQPITESISGSGTVELKLDLYLEVDFGANVCDAYRIRYIKNSEVFPYDDLDNFFQATVFSQSAPSIVKGVFIKDALNKMVQKAIGDESYSPVRSDLIDTNDCAELNFVTTGNKIRGLDLPINNTIETLLNFLRVRYNVGMSIVKDGSNTYVDIYNCAEFFKNTKILTVSKIKKARVRINNDILFNSIEVGYSKYSNPDKEGLRDGFNTLRGYLFPVTSVKKSEQLVCDVYTDGSEIERIKRLSQKDSESDQSDEDIFIIKCQKFNNSNRFDPGDYGNDSSVLACDRDSSENTVTVIGLVLHTLVSGDKMVLGSTTYTITGISLDYINNQTVLTMSSVTSNGITYNRFHFTDSSDDPKDIFLPERLSPFSNVSGLTDENWEYNIDHAPSNILLRWFNYLGGVLKEKAGSKKVKVTKKVNNTNLDKEYNSASCGLTTAGIVESQDFTLSNLRSYNAALFTGREFEITCYMLYDSEFKVMQNSLFGEHGSKDYGYIEFDYKGATIQAFPVDFDYKKKNQECTIICWEKA